MEFGFIALPFLMLLTAIAELALMFWTSQVLEEAVTQASRTLLTGQANSLYSGTPAANASAFKNAVCARAPGLVDCTKLAIDVKAYATFADAQTGTSNNSAVKNNALDTSSFGYTQPQAQQIVVVRAALEYSLYFTQWSSALANIGAGKRAIVASTTFRTEPFAGASS